MVLPTIKVFPTCFRHLHQDLNSKLKYLFGVLYLVAPMWIFSPRIQASRVSRFRFLGNAWWDRRFSKVSTRSRISAITEYSFQLRVCLPLIYAVFFHWNTYFTPFILVSNSINWWVNQLFFIFREKSAIKLYEFREGYWCLLVKCFKSLIISFWFLL